jgi:signal transduction histidine kinase
MRHEAAHALILATVLLVIAGFVMWVVSQSTLIPVRALGASMRLRRSFDFTPLPLDRLPRELHPLVDSFNHVLRQLDEAIEGERRFIGDAAHELRTPLSALQAQAEIALRATDPQDKETAPGGQAQHPADRAVTRSGAHRCQCQGSQAHAG